MELAQARAEAVTDKFLQKLIAEHPVGLQQAQTPDFQDALFTVQKEHAKAGDVHDRLQDVMPDYAVLGVDANSNQIILSGDGGLAKKTQWMIYLLDVPPYVDVKTEVFSIRLQDANVVADSIRELFEGVGGQGGGDSQALP